MSGDTERADEAFSRAGLLAWEKYPHQAEQIHNPSAWLARLTHNVCIDIHREDQRRGAWIETDSAIVANAPNLEWNLDQADPQQRFLDSEKKTFLLDAIRNLPARLRDVMQPLVIEHLSYREIALRLGVKEPALRKRVQQARAALRLAYAGYLDGESSGADLGQESLEEGRVDARPGPPAMLATMCGLSDGRSPPPRCRLGRLFETRSSPWRVASGHRRASHHVRGHDGLRRGSYGSR